MRNFDVYHVQEDDFFVKTRTIFLYGEITAETAYDVGGRLKFLDYIDPKKPVTIEINSPGGEVSSGLAIIDTIRFVSCPVKTVVCGMAASMAALIAACGDKGMRYALPHSSIMVHQPLGGVGISQASDIAIYAKNIVNTRKMLNQILAEACGKSPETVEIDTERDYYMNATEAKAYGLIDEIVTVKKG